MRAHNYRNGRTYYDEQGQLIWKPPGSRAVQWCFPGESWSIAEMKRRFPVVFSSPLYLRLRHGV